MKDVSGKWHQLRADAKHFASLGLSATDPSQRELFKRLSNELASEALELEQVVKSQTAHLGSHEHYDIMSMPVAKK
jgi:hypothetical protein